MTIYKANILFTKQNDYFEVIPNGFVAVRDGIVQGVYSELPADLRYAEVIDYGDRLLIPAMNDLHVHASQYHNQGIAMDMELLPWLENYTFPEEIKYADTNYAKRMYSRFVHDLWRFGTMRTVAFATIHEESTRLLMQLFEKAGMGAFVGKVDMNRNCPAELTEDTNEAMRANEAIIASYRQANRSHSALVNPIVTPRFIPSCTPDMLRACGDLARKYQLPVQSHLSENKNEIKWVQELEPESKFYGDAYYRYSLFGQTPTIMAHCVYSSPEEIELMSRQKVLVAHCPTSNLNVSSGMAPVRTILNAGVRVGLGSDISAGHDLSIFRVMVYAIQVSKMHYRQHQESCPFLTLSEAFYLATKSAGSFFGKVGSFEQGYEFDALLIDDSNLNHGDYSLPQRLERFVYLGDDRNIQLRFCRGKQIAEPEIIQ